MGRGSIVVLAVSGLVVCGALGTGPGLALATASAAARPAAATAAPVWGNAQQLPGIAALDDGGGAAPLALSCPSPGNCAVGGGYDDPADGSGSAAFVADQRNGTWDGATEVPGLAALNAGKVGQVDSLSCTAAGDCTAGGVYSPGGRALDAFVVTEKNDTWGRAIEVPGTAALNAGDWAEVSSVSCWAPGDCSAAGDYAPGGAASQKLLDSGAFVVTEKDGRWGGAVDPPGLAALNTGDASAAYSISCSAGGSCAVGGFYTTASGQQQAFVADESAGTWQPAEEVPGTGALNVNGAAVLSDVSCGSPGNCGAIGTYRGSNSGGSFVASETNGTWRTADALPNGVNADSISCASAGNCVAGGTEPTGVSTMGQPGSQASVITELNGTWGRPRSVPGLAGLNVGQAAGIGSVSCSAPGDCAAGGYYAGTQTARTTADQAFVVTETDGTWGRAEQVPGISALDAIDAASIDAVSCGSPQACTATGSDDDGGFLVSTKAPTTTTESLSAGKVAYGEEQAERVSVTVTAKTGGPPAGKVTVKAGSATLCVITLLSGRGSCTLTARGLQPGTYSVTAAYPGSPEFVGSVSPAKTLTVVK